MTDHCLVVVVVRTMQEGLVIADAKGLAKLDKEIESLRTEKKAIASELGEIGSRTRCSPLQQHQTVRLAAHPPLNAQASRR